MPPEDTTPEGAGTETPEVDELVERINADPTKTADEIRKLRKESRERKDRLDKAESDRLSAETARLESDKQWETLAQQRADQLKELAPKASQFEEYKAWAENELERRIAALPQQWRGIMPEVLLQNPRAALEWLNANESLFRLPVLPNTGAGQQGDRGQVGKQKVPMSADFIAMARKTGRTMEQAQKSWDREHNPE